MGARPLQEVGPRVMPATLMTAGEGEVATWRAGADGAAPMRRGEAVEAPAVAIFVIAIVIVAAIAWSEWGGRRD